MAFVLSNPTYLNDCRAILKFDDGSTEDLDRSAIGRKVIQHRFDITVFSHFVRRGGTASSQSSANLLQNLFCKYSQKNKRVTAFEFTITSHTNETVLMQEASCN